MFIRCWYPCTPGHIRNVLLFVSFSVINAFGQQSSSRTLDELIQMALANNQDIAARRQRIPEAKGTLQQAGLRPNPELDTSLGNGAVIGNSGLWSGAIGFSQTFELGGKRSHRVELADSDLKSTGLEVQERERILRFEVRNAFVEALAAGRNLAITRDLSSLTEDGLRLVAARVEQGESPPLERSLLQVESNRIKADIRLFQSQHERALMTLRQLVGLPQNEPLSIAGELVTTPVQEIALQEMLKQALANRPDILALKQQEQSGDAAVRLEQSLAIPNLTGFTRFNYDYDRLPQFGLNSGMVVPIIDRDRMLSVGVSIGLPVRNRNQGNIASAVARRESTHLRRQYQEQVVAREVQAALNRLNAAVEAAKLFDQGVLQQSSDNLRVIRSAYQLGELRLLDVVNEQRRLIDTQRTYTEILRENQLALAELETAIGATVLGVKP